MLSTTDIQAILQYGGPAVLLIFLLVSTIVVLWRHYLTQVKEWTETQLEESKAMITMVERSTSAITNLTELLKTLVASNNAYQGEMRNKVETALSELRAFRLEVMQQLYRHGTDGRRH